jgi:hypothetical protein
MPEFSSWLAYRYFSEAVIKRTRYIFDSANKHFLECIVATSASRKFQMPMGTPLWRAQLHEPNQKVWHAKEPFPAERMKPLLNCREGRLNPKSIPCLYLATDGDTAMSEVRPWVGAIGTLAEFRVVRELNLVSCAEKISTSVLLGWLAGIEPSPEERERHVWGEMNASFAEPMTSTDTTADYAPTQVLAEAFRSAGFDGVMYNSSVGRGIDVALFDSNSADVVPDGRKIFQTRYLDYTFDVGE